MIMDMRHILLIITVVFAVISAQAENYGINVGGVEVSSSNYTNVTGGAITGGTVVYNNNTKTLTLTGVTISRSGSSDRAIHNRSVEGLTIVLKGTCSFTGTGCSTLYFQKSTTLTASAYADATVTCTSSGDDAIWMNNSGSLTINGAGSLTLNSTKGEGIEGSSSPTLSLGIAKLTVTSARESFKNFKTITFTNPSFGSKVELSATGSSSYAHISSSTTVNLNSGVAFKSPTNGTVSDLKSTSYNHINFTIGNYVLELTSTNMPDANFRAKMTGSYPYGLLTAAQYNALDELDVSNRNISNLKGVELFPQLITLNCTNNNLTTLDVSNNTALTTLHCGKNKLTSLNVSNCTKLYVLECYNNNLTSLATAHMTNLKNLNCKNNKITSLNLSNNTKLQYIYCNDNALTSLNISSCQALKWLDCYNNSLSTLSVVNAPELTRVDASNNSPLTKIECYNDSKLSSVGYQNCNNIKTFIAYGTAIETYYLNNNDVMQTLDFHNCTAMTEITAHDNKALTSVNVSGCTALTKVNVYNNSRLTSLSVDGCTALTSLDASRNALTSINLLSNSALKYIALNGNDFTSFDASALTQALGINLANNPLTSITGVDKCRNLNRLCLAGYSAPVLSLNNCKIKDLSLYECFKLVTLNCYSSSIETLSIRYCTALEYLNCSNNNLTTIDNTNCKSLKTAVIYKNSLDLSAMATFINNLPTWSASSPGTLDIIYNDFDANMISEDLVTQANAKYWTCRKYNGSSWQPLIVAPPGDLNGDGEVNSADVSLLYSEMLSGNPGIQFDLNGDGEVNSADVSYLYQLMLN